MTVDDEKRSTRYCVQSKSTFTHNECAVVILRTFLRVTDSTSDSERTKTTTGVTLQEGRSSIGYVGVPLAAVRSDLLRPRPVDRTRGLRMV